MRETTLAKRFDERLRYCAVSTAIELNEIGLIFGPGTVLARMTRDDNGAPCLDLESQKPRVCALLAAAYGRAPSSDIFRHIDGAAEHWRRGDQALANIRLAFARLPRIEHREDLYRLFKTELLLDQGLPPDVLLIAFKRFEIAELAKYDPDQPRVPTGSGRASGQWTSGNTSSSVVGPNDTDASRAAATPWSALRASELAIAGGAAALRGTLAEGLFAGATGGEFLTGLAALGTAAGGAAVVLGAIFVPVQKNPIIGGPVPGDSGLHYSLDNDTGVLHFRESDDDQDLATAHRGRGGIFFETETGIPVARMLGGNLVFDAASLASEAEDSSAEANAHPGAAAETDRNLPQLCPDPGPDAPHGASPRAIAYQAQISAQNNPQRPLPPGLAVSLINSITGKRVVYDDCRESDGTMIEAKGPGYARLLRSSYMEDILSERWATQAERQVAASGGRDLEWFFAEPEAAAMAAEVFGDDFRLKKIKTHYEPALVY